MVMNGRGEGDGTWSLDGVNYRPLQLASRRLD
jgi:hypothetical protein